MTIPRSPHDRLEFATNKIGKDVGELLKVFELHGADLTRAQCKKVFDFLRFSLSKVEQKALLALEAAAATTGKFSLEMELPDEAVSRGERLVGQRGVVPSSQANMPDDDDGIAFIDSDD